MFKIKGTKGATYLLPMRALICLMVMSGFAGQNLFAGEIATPTSAAMAPPTTRKPAASSVELTRVSSYPEPIAVVSSTSQPRTLVIHLHGFVFGNPRDRSAFAVAKDMEFERIINAHPEAMIVMPASTGKNVTYNDRFKTAAQLETVVSAVLEQRSLNLESFDHVIITGHSGAYKTIGRMLQTFKGTTLGAVVDRIALFDATYGTVPADYATWIGPKSMQRCLQVVYRAGTDTQNNALQLKKGLEKITSGKPESCYAIFPSKSNDHWKTVPAHFEQLVFP